MGWHPLLWIEHQVYRLVGYPLLFVQFVLLILVAWGVVGGELGLTDLFWNEDLWSQFWVGFFTCWLFGVVVFVNTLLHAPRAMPGLPTIRGKIEYTYFGWPTLFPSE